MEPRPKRYRASCHCGSVEFDFSLPEITQALRCDCSICARKGVSLSTTVIAPDQMEIRDPENRITTYQFGTLTARHHFCNRCGIHVFVETRLNPGHYRVNLGCIEGIDAMRLPTTVFDGKSL